MINRLILEYRRILSKFLPRGARDRRRVFTKIYRLKKWGGEHATNTDFHSGKGSLPANTSEYEQLVAEFINSNGVKSVVDIGCGDFQVAHRILNRLDTPIKYLGCDVVEDLVNRNKSIYGAEQIRFQVLDAVEDPLPDGELILIREVLQHLSNESIQIILSKVAERRWCLVTDSLHIAMNKPNINIVEGGRTRVAIGSGLDLRLPPFEQSGELLLTRPQNHNHQSILQTILLNSD